MSSCEKTSAAVADLLQGGIYYTEKTLGSQESTVKASMKSAIIPFIKGTRKCTVRKKVSTISNFICTALIMAKKGSGGIRTLDLLFTRQAL